LKNLSIDPVDLSVFSCIEFCLWNAYDDMVNFQRNLNTGEVEVENGVIYHKTEYRERRNHFAFFACSEPLEGFDTQREAFLGSYRGWDNPVTVEQGYSQNSIASGWSPVGSHHIKLTLEPGERRTVVYLLGYHENLEDEKFDPPDSQIINKKSIKPILETLLNLDNADIKFKELREFWAENIEKFQVETPDVHVNRMVNIWNAYQCMTTFNLSRSASYFEAGISRGMGFRDSNQDIFGFVHMNPSRARQRILDLSSTQLQSGGVYHQYQPLTKLGNNEVGSKFNDDPLWLILSTIAYLKETGDWSILSEVVPFENTFGTEQTLLEHLHRSLQYVHDRLGPHALPLIGRADWNDCLNLNCYSTDPNQSFQTVENTDGTSAESIFIAALFILVAKNLAEIYQICEWEDKEVPFQAWAQEMEDAILQFGWDGAWFLRAYDNQGQKIGSHDCTEGQIFIETQGLCVMAGIGLETGLATTALKSVGTVLATPHGILLHQPAYTRYYLNLGEISSYPPGYKENASVFCHTNPWIIIAETLVGNGDQALDYYLRINPSVREEISEIHRCEPYIYAQTIAGRDAPNYGEAKNSWLTGTASWMYVSITQWILGIRPNFLGLEVKPIIPSDWPGFTAIRMFRGVAYHITVSRQGEGNNVSLEVDGHLIDGTVIPLPEKGTTTVNVNAILT
ncbi:MAG TPA: glycosyl transferase, partial [Candidatus Lokiarchaeia archaeon]|nr:glycosyl transferase [Candidatus Lokiarchaeia archaeon]